MKKLLLLFALLGIISLNVNAQACSHATKASAEKMAATAVSADAAATADLNIQKRVCQKTGTVSFVRKVVSTDSGKVSYDDVEYCTKSGGFINVSPMGGADGMAAKTVSGTSSTKKSCCTKGASSCSSKGKGGAAASSATKTSLIGGKKASCCSKGAKSCSKGAKAASTEMAPVKTKLVKAEN